MEKTNYTVFLSKDNFKKMEQDDDYIILASKECLYTADPYYVVEFQVVGEDPEDHDPEIILNGLGALAFHEDGSNAFLILESDITELEQSFSWEGSCEILMSELLTVSDKVLLLKKKQEANQGEGPIWINVGNKDSVIWRPIENASQEIFEDKSNQYKFGQISNPSVDIWWPFIFKDECGYYVVIQKDDLDDEEEGEQVAFPLAHRINPYDKDYDDFFQDPEDYGYMRRYGGC